MAQKQKDELVQVSSEILNLEKKLDRLYEKRRELINYLDLNKTHCKHRK